MEDDDEFGDLYTDVLRPFVSSSSSTPHPTPSPAPTTSKHPIDLNIRTDGDEIIYGGSYSDSVVSQKSMGQTPAPKHTVAVKESVPAAAANSGRDMIDRDQIDKPRLGKAEDSAQPRVFERGHVEFADRALQDMGYGKEPAIDDSRKEVDVKGADLMDKDVKFDIEEDGNGIEDAGSEPIIPGLSTVSGGVLVAATGAETSRRVDESGEGGEGDEWDSDSEDDLQIVLNDNGHMAMERGGMVADDDDEDEDGDPLVIVGDGDPNQAVEEAEWGEDTAQTGDSERKDMGEAAKGSGGVTVAPKVGYSNHGFHPFHSQFKYVRPGAAPMPGPTTSAPGGPPGQIRPLVLMAGRGRGDWRPAGMKGAPTMQKGFHSGPGLPVWSNNAGRGFGGGLEFTLPSHKTIFDVDIDGFEEKPWKYPGVDPSDFFNFGLNEESWKDYCKQLEQLRLESTMQSKIRVYESGRTEQEYDPDLPPELAAATGIRDVPIENTNSVKSDVGQNDLAKGSGRMRPPLPTGRTIQVENGYGERLPSIDTRPPRIRDSDAIIEIVLLDSADDDSYGGNVGQDLPEREPLGDFREDRLAGDENHEIPQMENESSDGLPPHYNGQKIERSGIRMQFMNSSPSSIPERDEILPFHQQEPVNCPGSRDQSPRYSGGNFGASYEERRMHRRAHDRSPCITRSQEITSFDNPKEESVESMEGRRSALSSSPVIKDARDSSLEDEDAEHDDTGTADGSSRMEKEETELNTMDRGDALKDVEAKRQKLTSQAEQPQLDKVDDWDDSKGPRSSDNSKARSASSRDYQKHRDGFEEEVVQEAQSSLLGGIRRHLDEHERGCRRREHELDRNRMVHKTREESYPHKERHPSSTQQLHAKADVFDRKKDRENSDITWAKRDDDPYGRRVRNEESRKRNREKVLENQRSDKDDSLHSRKQFDNGSYRVPYDKDLGSRDSRQRERDDGFKSRCEGLEDYHGKRRKDEEYIRKDYIDKEEILPGYKENTSRRRRERDELLDPRKRDSQQRSKDNLDDHYAARQKDEGWLMRERGDRQRDREEWHRLKQSHGEHPPKREREEGRGAVRSGRVTEEKAWVGHPRSKDEHKVTDKEYPSRDTMRHNERSKRRERIQDENPHHRGREEAYARGNQYSSEERQLRRERSSSHSDRAANASDNPPVHEKKLKGATRKRKQSEVSYHNSLGLSKRNQEDQSGQINESSLKGSGDEERAENELPGHRLSRGRREDVSSEDKQEDSSRGRSKLERWTSQKERDFGISSKSSSSLRFGDIDKDNNDGSSEAGKAADESAKAVDAIEKQNFVTAEGKDSVDMESKDGDAKGLGDRHLDTVEKLKKRSERFKLPMPSEKDALAIKKMESEPLPSAKSENPADPEVKQERPARKRRWISG